MIDEKRYLFFGMDNIEEMYKDEKLIEYFSRLKGSGEKDLEDLKKEANNEFGYFPFTIITEKEKSMLEKLMDKLTSEVEEKQKASELSIYEIKEKGNQNVIDFNNNLAERNN